MNTKVHIGDEKLEKELTESTIAELFNYLHYRLEKQGKPVMIGVQYQDVFI